MYQNPEHTFLGQIGIWDAEDGVEETLNLYLDLGSFEYLVCAIDLPDGDRETTFGVQAFLHRVPDAEPVVRRLILDKLDPIRAAQEARIELLHFDMNHGPKPSGNLWGLRVFHGVH
jgi:hypothetical protein